MSVAGSVAAGVAREGGQERVEEMTRHRANRRAAVAAEHGLLAFRACVPRGRLSTLREAEQRRPLGQSRSLGDGRRRDLHAVAIVNELLHSWRWLLPESTTATAGGPARHGAVRKGAGCLEARIRLQRRPANRHLDGASSA